MKIGVKFHVPSRGIMGNNNIWRIYKNVDKGHGDTLYTDHIEIFGVQCNTGEEAYRIGFSLLCEGEVSVDFNPDDNFRIYVIIHDGSYKAKYIDKNGEIVENED